MKKISSILLLLILLSGCVGIGGTRTYVSGVDKIVLSSDNTFAWYEYHNSPTTVWTGKYKEDNATVLFILNSVSRSYEMQKTGKNLTLKAGRDSYVWVLQ